MLRRSRNKPRRGLDYVKRSYMDVMNHQPRHSRGISSNTQLRAMRYVLRYTIAVTQTMRSTRSLSQPSSDTYYLA